MKKNEIELEYVVMFLKEMSKSFKEQTKILKTGRLAVENRLIWCGKCSNPPKCPDCDKATKNFQKDYEK